MRGVEGGGGSYNALGPVTRLRVPQQKRQIQRDKMKKGKRSKANKNKMQWTS
jgi:hypothetical protein